MTEKAGETARENAQYRCERCEQLIKLRSGDLIPPCPNCGFDTYDIHNPRVPQPELNADQARDAADGQFDPGAAARH
jgi:predicted  nucleic acid-binding Zn-ribbon protein